MIALKKHFGKFEGRQLLALALIVACGIFAARVSAEEPAKAGKAEFVGASTCLQCHDTKAAFKDNIHAKAWPKAKGIDFEHSCETCHGAGSLHVGAGGDKNNPDFYTIKNPKKISSKDLSTMCMQCHEGGTHKYWEGSQHDSRNVSCVSCHSMHDSKSENGKFLLTKPTEMETCFQCHNTKKAQIMRSSHMPLSEGKMTCTDCHNPHGSVGPTLLKQNSVNENCLSCHQEKRGPFLWEHPPVRENCLNCHVAHGSQNDKLLKMKRPRLCQECHISTNHPPTPYGANKSLTIAGRSCTECHSQIHGSNHPAGVRFQR
jgi:DmsE family decaheme c-type cytochrome